MKIVFFIIPLSLLLSSCYLQSAGYENATDQIIETKTSPVTSTFTPPTDVLTPTLNPEQMAMRVSDLLQNNGDCNLPCWWGVVPGKTTWMETRDLLTPIAISIYGDTDTSKPVNYEVFLPVPYPHHGEYRQEYLVESNIVKMIEILPQQYSRYSIPKRILLEYGEPEIAYLGITIDQLLSSEIILYYPNLGIFALYASTLQPIQNTESMEICFREIDYVDIFLWDPKDSFDKVLQSIFESYENTFLPMETVTDISISEFKNIFTDPDQPDCLKILHSLWPDHTPTN